MEMVNVLPLPLSLKRSSDAEGQAEKLKKQGQEIFAKSVSGTMSALQMFGLFGLHGATIAIIFGLFTMHEGNSDGRGSKLSGMLS